MIVNDWLCWQTEILISPWVLQRSPQYWDKPDEFLPQRWANGGKGLLLQIDLRPL